MATTPPPAAPPASPSSPPPPPPRPGWGHHTTLFQLHQPAFWLFVILLLATAYLTLIEQAALTALAPGGWLLSWFLLLFYFAPVFLLILYLDLYEREPMSLIVAALLWGGVVATALAMLANSGWALVLNEIAGPEFTAEWGAALTAPWTEEILKGTGVVVIFLIARREMDDIMDGFVYGAMIGLGFAVVEDVFYFIAHFGGEPGGVLFGFFIRVIASGLYGHILWTGLIGIGVAYFVSRREEATVGRRLAVAVGLFVLAMAGHFLWNSPLLNFFPEVPLEGADYFQIMVAAIIKALPILIFVAVMIGLARNREHRWLRGALHTEVGLGGLTAEELAVLEKPALRRRARKDMAARGGPVAAATLKRLHREQINLAMVRSRAFSDDDPELVRQRDYCRSLREWLAQFGPRAPGSAPAT